MNPRVTAVKILIEVIQKHRSLTTVFQQKLSSAILPRDSSLIKQYCFGVLRFYHRLLPIAHSLVYTPLKIAHRDIEILMLIGLYQLIYLETPAYAAVSETVAGAAQLNKKWAKGLINQALQSYLRTPTVYLEKADTSLTGKFSHPQWLIEEIKQDWPVEWSTILAANNQQAPLFLRVNIQKISRQHYLNKLLQNNIEADLIDDLPQAIRLVKPSPVEALPGFFDGECSVQDLSSQLISKILNILPGQRVLDACAAPGGKTSLILENFPEKLQLVAIEKDAERTQQIIENLQRLHQAHEHVEVLVADATQPDSWWDGRPFDWILVDAPCSGTGVIRRHPDIKIIRQPSDVVSLADQQSRLLNSLWKLLAPGGKLLYTTCSLLKSENEKTIESFCVTFPDALLQPIDLSIGFALKFGHQLLPSENGPDGFYYALLKKISNI